MGWDANDLFLEDGGMKLTQMDMRLFFLNVSYDVSFRVLIPMSSTHHEPATGYKS